MSPKGSLREEINIRPKSSLEVCVCLFVCLLCVLLCFIQPVLGNRYNPWVSLSLRLDKFQTTSVCCFIQVNVFCFLLLNRYWGMIVKVPGLPRVNRPQTTWGGRILTLHLNYVADYINHLLFLFERTQQLTPWTTKGKPWRLRVWAGPKFVWPQRWGPWAMKIFLW